MKHTTTTETAVICVAVVLAIALVNAHSAGPAVILWLAMAGVIALAVVLGFRYLTTRKRAQIELTVSEQYRQLAEEYRRLADLAITAQEHTDLRLGDVSAQLDYLREQTESLHKILKEVE